MKLTLPVTIGVLCGAFGIAASCVNERVKNKSAPSESVAVAQAFDFTANPDVQEDVLGFNAPAVYAMRDNNIRFEISNGLPPGIAALFRQGQVIQISSSLHRSEIRAVALDALDLAVYAEELGADLDGYCYERSDVLTWTLESHSP